MGWGGKQSRRKTYQASITGMYARISEQTLVMNDRTRSDMIDRFYGSHIKKVLDKGSKIVDRVNSERKNIE